MRKIQGKSSKNWLKKSLNYCWRCLKVTIELTKKCHNKRKIFVRSFIKDILYLLSIIIGYKRFQCTMPDVTFFNGMTHRSIIWLIFCCTLWMFCSVSFGWVLFCERSQHPLARFIPRWFQTQILVKVLGNWNYPQM